jgi:REP element-mobilizing transposase RayT
VHHVSAVKYRRGLILPEFEERLHRYIIGIIKELNQIPIQVNGMCDHIHIAARLRPAMAPAVFVPKVKASSSKWINENRFLPFKFAWQVGGGTFSISETHVAALTNYVKNQKQHHKKKSFKTEYIKLLESHGLKPDADYLPEFFEDLY